MSTGLTTFVSFIIPPGVVRDALVVWSILAILAYPIKWCSPSAMTNFLVDALEGAERIYHGAVQRGLFAADLESAHAHMQELVDIEDLLHRLQIDVSELREKTLYASLCPWKEIIMLFKGHSFHVLRCKLAVRRLSHVDTQRSSTPRAQRAQDAADIVCVSGRHCSHPIVG